MAGYGLFGKIVATAGNGDVLAGYLRDAASALRDVEGCHLYVVSRDPADAEAVWVVEFWESAEAHQASLDLSSVQELISRARPIIAAMGERFELEPLGGKGLGRNRPDTRSDRGTWLRSASRSQASGCRGRGDRSAAGRRTIRSSAPCAPLEPWPP